MSHTATHHDHAAHGDHGGIAKYIFVFLALCVLTTMSFFTYSRFWPWHEEPAVARLFMTAVSCTKAMLVILFFMHVKYSSKLTKLTVAGGLFTFLVLISLTLADYFTRAWGRW